MSTLFDRIPTNKNFLLPTGFTVLIKKLPMCVYFCQGANLPGITGSPPTYTNPFNDIPVSYDHLQFNRLEIDFKVDEDMRNYIELTNWIKGLGFPESYDEYKALTEATPLSEIASDMSLLIHSSKDNPKFEVTFRDAFPVMISDLSFDTRTSLAEPINAKAMFAFRDHVIQPV